MVLLCISAVKSFGQFRLQVIPVDKNQFFIDSLRITPEFKSKDQLDKYIDALLTKLQVKGYATASIDSIAVDSTLTTVGLFAGEIYNWTSLRISGADKKIIDAVSLDTSRFNNKVMNISQYQVLQEKMLGYYESRGYPFAKIFIDSMTISENNEFSGVLKIEPGPLYKIDSIRVYGNAKISNDFLQQYLELPNGSIYQKEKLQRISTRIRELPYVQEQQPWNLSMLGTGSILNLYLQQKKSSQVNVLIGFLPSNEETGKLLFTGEAHINLQNALGNGEGIGINWQQLQPKSPRLNLSFNQPYLFKSPFGVNTAFDLYKKDSSYVNINFLIGAQYNASSFQTASVYIQNQKTNVLTIDTFQVLNTRRLPDIADVSSINFGVLYNLNKTDYRFNPRRGNELTVNTSVGTRKIKRSESIIKLRDPGDPAFQFASLYDSVKQKSYQFRIRGEGAHYFPLTRVSTIKAALQGGWLQSPTIFRNELFQLGGYRILRGFDEESIFASQFLVATTEYRYLIGQNSFLFTFLDFGWTNNTQRNVHVKNNFIGGGLGLAFETKAGIFNISYAAGKRNDAKFDLRQSKIHLGFVSFF
ncbi:MAG TPA: BamA/TamA family outer membrane protein [Chitinophagaceae bacterium]|nr:BamA/TamA family outer membrane protein [Chitinophagaceae bacterium]